MTELPTLPVGNARPNSAGTLREEPVDQAPPVDGATLASQAESAPADHGASEAVPAEQNADQQPIVVDDEKGHDLKWLRRGLLLIWAAAVAWEFAEHGIAFDRTRVIVLMLFGMAAATVGRRRVITVLIDWAPFVLILLLYDWVRDVAIWLDMPTQWQVANDVDVAMFGVNPTVWLQTHLKLPEAPWWEVIVSVVYISYFLVPYATAGVLWVRNRATWRRFAVCFVATSFVGLIGYTLVPAAPPWAVSMCTAAEVADHPRDPECMHRFERVDGNIMGEVNPVHEGATPHVERISWRGWRVLGLNNAAELLKMGQGKVNLVAAIPSLHAGLTMMLALFMWPRTKALGRTLFMGYAVAMAFALVYTAEHFVFDIILGWLVAAVVVGTVAAVDRRFIAPRNRARERQRELDREAAVAQALAEGPAEPVELKA